MSALGSVEAAVKAELFGPEGRKAIESVEDMLLRVALVAVNAILPGIVKTLAGGIISSLEEKGIKAIESFTDEELRKIGATVISDSQGTSIIYPAVNLPNSDKVHNSAELAAVEAENALLAANAAK